MRGTTLRRFALGALLLLCAVSGCGGGSDAVAPTPSLGSVVNLPVPSEIANLPLTKPDGTTTTLAAYRGKTVMIADFLSLCTDICPMISANTAALARALNGDGQQQHVALLEITVDPHRDTPARLRAYQKLYGPAISNWTLLRATPADTAKLWKFFGVEYRRQKEEKPPDIDWLTHKPLTYDVAHSDVLIFLAADGHERFVVNADPNASANTPPTPLVKLLSAQGVHNLNHPNPVVTWTVKQGLSVFSWLLDTRLAVSR